MVGEDSLNGMGTGASGLHPVATSPHLGVIVSLDRTKVNVAREKRFWPFSRNERVDRYNGTSLSRDLGRMP
jgi:hypothetical protein